MRAHLTLGVVALAVGTVGCTTPYRIDAGSRVDGGPIDAGLDTSVPFDGGPDSPDSPDAFTCNPSCIDASQLSPCLGADPIDCELGCISGPPAHCGVMVVANVDDALATTPPNGDVVALNAVIETGTCIWPSLLAPIMGRLVDLDDGRVCLFVFASLTIPAGVEVRAEGPYPLIVMSEGEVQIHGELSVDSRRASSASTSPETLGAGSGTGGASGIAGTPGGSFGGGGGGGGFATAGGRGGNASSGGLGGDGGLAASYLLEPLVGGARGGAGGGPSPSVGGPGGGAIQVSSRVRIIASGYLGASGGGGARGGTTPVAGAGGGSGGAILLEAPEIALSGELNVSGGGGGSGGCLSGTGSSGSNGAGELSTPAGGAPCALGGGPGGRGAGSSSTGGGNAGSSGGGGGGAGVVRFRVYAPLMLPGAARLNPRVSPGLYTIHPLAIR